MIHAPNVAYTDQNEFTNVLHFHNMRHLKGRALTKITLFDLSVGVRYRTHLQNLLYWRLNYSCGRVQFFCAIHALFKVFVIFHLCIFFDPQLSLHCPLYALTLKYLHITISPQQCRRSHGKISFSRTHIALWCHIL